MIQLRFKNGAEKHLRAADVLWIHKVEIHKVEGTWLPGTGMHTCTHRVCTTSLGDGHTRHFLSADEHPRHFLSSTV